MHEQVGDAQLNFYSNLTSRAAMKKETRSIEEVKKDFGIRKEEPHSSHVEQSQTEVEVRDEATSLPASPPMSPTGPVKGSPPITPRGPMLMSRKNTLKTANGHVEIDYPSRTVSEESERLSLDGSLDANDQPIIPPIKLRTSSGKQSAAMRSKAPVRGSSRQISKVSMDASWVSNNVKKPQLQVMTESLQMTTTNRDDIIKALLADRTGTSIRSLDACSPGSVFLPGGPVDSIQEETEDLIVQTSPRRNKRRSISSPSNLPPIGSGLNQHIHTQLNSIDDFEVFTTTILTSQEANLNQKAAHMQEFIEDTFTKMWLHSRHLALILELFAPLGLLKKSKYFGTYRVEVCVSLFERIIDVHNFELVLRVLDPFEKACVLCRIGWLSIMNPMKPEGAYMLDMSIHEERVVAKCLCTLTMLEPGDTWRRMDFAWNRDDPNPMPRWELAATWYTESGLPRRGMFHLSYYGGDGRGLKDCKPDVPLRKSLLQLVNLSELDITRESAEGDNVRNGGADTSLNAEQEACFIVDSTQKRREELDQLEGVHRMRAMQGEHLKMVAYTSTTVDM